MQARRFIVCLVLAIALATTGCSSASRVSYIPEGGAYKAGDLPDLLEAANPGASSRVAPDRVAEVRQEALADLRGNGDDAAALANTLTSEFPTDVTAIPFAVERGTYEGEPAWIVFESWGEPGESLTHRRVWVFSRNDLSILDSRSMR